MIGLASLQARYLHQKQVLLITLKKIKFYTDDFYRSDVVQKVVSNFYNLVSVTSMDHERVNFNRSEEGPVRGKWRYSFVQKITIWQ